MGLADEIQRLQQLHNGGALTDEEFAQAKAALLAGESAGNRTKSTGRNLLQV